MTLEEIRTNLEELKPEGMTTRELIEKLAQLNTAIAQVKRAIEELDNYKLGNGVEACDEASGSMFAVVSCLQDQEQLYTDAVCDLEYEIFKRLDK
ncbi:MAG: hypothetical protein SOX65_04605 [Porphyromonas sp.]|uniref:hypothetical protein n=1 Tax=Porphyromonas sp. TaxID=1924944 RepID=UPI002A80658F|nr:hypothetical protein [Porphyromonas sp.]MDY4245744.1 hypothetical protein [Porphyromonas sp.]